MEPALVESFAEKVVAEIRRQQAMSPGPGMSQTFIPAQQARSQRHNRSYSPMGLAITSMVLAIPLTAIARDGRRWAGCRRRLSYPKCPNHYGILFAINHIYRNTLFAVEYYKLVYISIRYCSENIDAKK